MTQNSLCFGFTLAAVVSQYLACPQGLRLLMPLWSYPYVYFSFVLFLLASGDVFSMLKCIRTRNGPGTRTHSLVIPHDKLSFFLFGVL